MVQQRPGSQRGPQRGQKRGQKNQQRREIEKPNLLETWKPITELGRAVRAGEITDIDQIFTSGQRIMEPEITDFLFPNLKTELLLIGQAKGKFGGGQRRIFRQTQKKTREGNRIQFATCALVGNGNGYVGVAFGKSKETVPARDKSQRRAKIQIMKVRRGCGSWEGTPNHNSIPFAVTGKCGSSKITLIPAPEGTGLCIEKECAKILKLAGIQDIWSKTVGQTKTKVNLIKACVDALKQLSEVKIQPHHVGTLGIQEGKDPTGSSETVLSRSISVVSKDVLEELSEELGEGVVLDVVDDEIEIKPTEAIVEVEEKTTEPKVVAQE